MKKLFAAALIASFAVTGFAGDDKAPKKESCKMECCKKNKKSCKDCQDCSKKAEPKKAA